MATDANALLRRYVVLDKLGEQITQEKTELRRQLQKWMEEREFQSFKGPDGAQASFSSKPKVRVSFKVDDKRQVFQWLKETGNQGIVSTVVNKQTLAKVVATMRERGEDIPEFIRVYDDPGFQIRAGNVAIPRLEDLV